MTPRIRQFALVALALAVIVPACGKKKPPVAAPTTPPAVITDAPAVPPPTTSRPAPPEPPRMPDPAPTPLAADDISTKSLDDINKAQVLKPIFFALDSDQIDAVGQQVLVENAAALKKYAGWSITIEGHTDERGTPEYNLALGERRALAVS